MSRLRWPESHNSLSEISGNVHSAPVDDLGLTWPPSGQYRPRSLRRPWTRASSRRARTIASDERYSAPVNDEVRPRDFDKRSCLERQDDITEVEGEDALEIRR